MRVSVMVNNASVLFQRVGAAANVECRVGHGLRKPQLIRGTDRSAC